MELPRFFVMTVYDDSRYLSYINGDDIGVKERGILKLSGKEVGRHLTKFEIEMANGGLVHIKSCYNNKYWQRLSDNTRWIVAGANEKEEDTSKWSCTLFNPIHKSSNLFQFYHVQLGEGLSFTNYCIMTTTTGYSFSIIDWATLVILPKHVAFRGKKNHAYVKAIASKNPPYLQFSANKITDLMVGNEIFSHNGGSICIKNNHFKKFWKRNHQDWITIDADESSINDKDTLFSPIIDDDNIIALRNEGNSKFCKLLTTKEVTSCLSAVDSNISSFSRMEVEDLVLSCSIVDVDYHLMDGRIYDQTIVTVACADAENITGETVHMDVKLSYTDVMTWSMSSNLSSKLGYKSKVSASIPKIADAKAKITGRFSGEYSWGKTKEMKNTVEVVYHAILPPMTKVEVYLIARKGSCDIPFSYTQEDVLKNGRTVIDNMEDGIYTCSNWFDYNIETSEEPI